MTTARNNIATLLAIPGFALLAVATWGWHKQSQPIVFPEIYVTSLTPRDEATIDRLASAGRHTEAIKVLVQAIQIGPDEPTIIASCRRETTSDYWALDCIHKLMIRKRYDDETAMLDRASRAAR